MCKDFHRHSFGPDKHPPYLLISSNDARKDGIAPCHPGMPHRARLHGACLAFPLVMTNGADHLSLITPQRLSSSAPLGSVIHLNQAYQYFYRKDFQLSPLLAKHHRRSRMLIFQRCQNRSSRQVIIAKVSECQPAIARGFTLLSRYVAASPLKGYRPLACHR